MWKKIQSKFDSKYIMESQRVKDVFATTFIDKWDVVAEDGVVYRVSTSNDIKKYKGSDYWILRTPGIAPDYRVLPGYELATNWHVYSEPLPTGTASAVPLSASKTWREYYHKSSPKQRVYIQDIYKISLIGGQNTYRVEGVDGGIYNVPALMSADDFSLEHCKLVKTAHPNGNFYYSLLPGSSFATFYHPVDGDPQPVEIPPIQDGDLKPLNTADAGTMLLPVNQTLQFVTIFSAALSALIGIPSERAAGIKNMVDHAYRIAEVSTEKLCGPQ